jgi:hypothetical protein
MVLVKRYDAASISALFIIDALGKEITCVYHINAVEQLYCS